MQKFSNMIKAEGKTIAFVPTMGFLHEGHASLLNLARKKADVLVLSIFVNPAQFGPNEDLAAYPRDPERDSEVARKEGVDIIFMPKPDDLYPEGYETYVNLENLPGNLCGLSRPGHFRGVATVVSKLFNIVKPNVAFFGQKDFQQLAVIKKMTADLNFDIEIVGVPIVREADGLAMSSRNAYLDKTQRQSALCLHKAIQMAQKMVAEGILSAEKIIAESASIISNVPESAVDYLEIVDPGSFGKISVIDRPALFALAVKIGKTRLIDNTVLVPAGK